MAPSAVSYEFLLCYYYSFCKLWPLTLRHPPVIILVFSCDVVLMRLKGLYFRQDSSYHSIRLCFRFFARMWLILYSERCSDRTTHPNYASYMNGLACLYGRFTSSFSCPSSHLLPIHISSTLFLPLTSCYFTIIHSLSSTPTPSHLFNGSIWMPPISHIPVPI